MNKQITTFEAKCASCGKTFEHPSLGPAYGEIMLCSTDGKHYSWASAFSELPQKLNALLPGVSANIFWGALAHFADPISGQKLAAHIHCSHCASSNIELWEGKRIGVMSVPEASFHDASALSAQELRLRVSTYSARVSNS